MTANFISKIISIKFLIFSIFLLNFIFNNHNVGALSVEDTCSKVETIYARGSGAKLGDQNNESKEFRAQLKSRISSPLTLHSYELGAESYNGNQYPAVGVGPDSVEYISNSLGAFVSAGMGNAYGKSVQSGVGELQSYLEQRYDKCKSSGTYFILAGHSQGAQVIGQALSGIPKQIRDRIIFVGLFGDPKLYLPEGEGFLDAPACRGKDLSEYRRIIGDCHLSQGRLSARKPYLPDDMKSKTGLWCYSHDYVCGTSQLLFDNDGHGTYANPGMAIDAAAQEAAIKLLAAIKKEPKTEQPSADNSQLINTKFNIGTGMNGQDVLFVVDRSSSMAPYLPAIRQNIKDTGSEILANGGHFAVVSYCSMQIGSNIFQPIQQLIPFEFPYDRTYLNYYIDAITVPCATTYPNDMLYVLYRSISALSWHNGAAKSLIWLTNGTTSVEDPEPLLGISSAMLAKLSLSIDPVNIYPVVPQGSEPLYQQIADSTSGQVVPFVGTDIITATNTAYQKIQNRPVPFLKNTQYISDPGQEITFDASDSYVIDSTITKYDWDFDGDSVFEASTTAPTIDHTYNQQFDGTMQVRVTAANGTVATASATVKVGTYQVPALPAAPTKITSTVVSTEDNKSTVRLNWTPADNLTAKWALTVNGVPLGLISPDQTSIDVTDVDRSIETSFGIAGVTSENMIGDAAFAVIEGPQLTMASANETEPLGESDTINVQAYPATINLSKQIQPTLTHVNQNLDDNTVLGIEYRKANSEIGSLGVMDKAVLGTTSRSDNEQKPSVSTIRGGYWWLAIPFIIGMPSWWLYSRLRKNT